MNHEGYDLGEKIGTNQFPASISDSENHQSIAFNDNETSIWMLLQWGPIIMIWPSIMVLWWQAESSPSQVIYGVFCEVIIEDRPYYNGTAQFHASAIIFYQMSAVFFFFFFAKSTFTILHPTFTKSKMQFPQSV